VNARWRLLDGPGRQPAAASLAWAVCALQQATLGGSSVVAWVVIAALPGLALSPFVPINARRSTALAVTSACLASLCFWTIAIPWMSLLGIPISRLSLIALAGAVCLATLVLAHRFGAEAEASDRKVELSDALGLTLSIAVAAVVANRLSSTPPLGGDWGHYWLFADQIRATGTLEATNPFWMGGGMKFSDYPGLPGVLAAWLELANRSARSTSGLIGLLFIFLAAVTWVTARVAWGSGAAVIAGVMSALIPATASMVAWSGLATIYSLVFCLPLLAATAGLLKADGNESTPIQLSIAALAVAALASQPMIALTVLAGVVSIVAIDVLVRRGKGASPAALTLAAVAVLGLPIMLDYRTRLQTLGGVQPYSQYLQTRLALDALAPNNILPILLIAIGLAGVIAAAAAKRSRPLALALLGVAASATAYTQLWRVGISGEYRRGVYVIGPLIAVGAGGLATLKAEISRPLKLLLGALLIASVAISSSGWINAQRGYFAVATQASWAAANQVAERIESNEAVVADSCWAFPAVGIERVKVFGALLPHQIGPSSEAPLAALARRVLEGEARGRAAAKKLGVRWSFTDPTCPTPAAGLGADGVPKGFVPVSSTRHLIVGYLPSLN